MALRKIGSWSAENVEARIYRDAEWEEFRVRLYVNGVLEPKADCHTDDKTEALAAAKVMVNSRLATLAK